MLNNIGKLVKNVTNFIHDSSSHYLKYNKKNNHNKASPYFSKRNIKRLIPVGMFSVICALSVISISAIDVGVWYVVGSSYNYPYWEKQYYKVNGYDSVTGNASVTLCDEAGVDSWDTNYWTGDNNVYIDGNYYGTWYFPRDIQWTHGTNSQYYTIPSLSQGEHTIKLEPCNIGSETVTTVSSVFKITVPYKKYTNKINVRYQNVDGSWGNYTTVYNQDVVQGTNVSWSRNADSIYKYAGISYNSTGSATKYVDVYRQVYNLKVSGDYGVESITGNWGYYAGSTAHPTYKIKTGYHVTSFTGEGNDAGKTWTEHNNKMGTINDTWGMTYNRAGYLHTAPNKVSIAYHINGGTVNSSKYSVNQYGYVQDSSGPWFHQLTYGKSEDLYNAATLGLAKTGYSFVGWENRNTGTFYNQDISYGSTQYYGKNTSDTTENSVSVECHLQAKWKINTYTNSIGHWAWGFTKGEGNNGDKRAFNLSNTSFSKEYNASYTLNNLDAVEIPNGFYLEKTFGTDSINGSWNHYELGYTGNQQAKDMFFEYDYSPYTYNITYDLDGGTNSTSNPSTYNVLYGVSLKNPTKKGYRFLGWYEGSKKVTGINEGANASFSSASDLYSKLKTRRTGDVKLTAKWQYITYYIQYDLNDSSLIDKVNYSVKDNNGNLSGHETVLFDDDYALQDPQPTTKYIFKGWNTKADGSGKMYTKYINQDGSVCSAGNTLKLYAIWETTPIMKAKDFYLIEGVPVPNDVAYSGVGFDKTPTEKYPDKMTKVTYPIKGITMNGTDISNRIEIDYIELNGSKVSSISTNKIGKYTIHYSLTDGKDTKKFTRNITVLPASTPNINAGDKYFKKNTDITVEDLKENISANDKYDGDLVTKVEIIDKDNINENESGVYEITYSVTNTSNKTITKKVHVFIIDYLPDNRADADNSFRYIRKDCSEANDYCLQYFANDSKWNTDDTLKDMLMDSLSKADDQAPVKKYSFKAKDVQKSKSE